MKNEKNIYTCPKCDNEYDKKGMCVDCKIELSDTINLKQKCNETPQELFIKYFGNNWSFDYTNLKLVNWVSVMRYYKDIMHNGKRIRVNITRSSLPNISKIFKNLIKRTSLEKNKTSASFKRQVKRIV